MKGNKHSREHSLRVYRYVGGMRIGILASISYALKDIENLTSAMVSHRCDFWP